ncbi:MAG TPA: hypothetical protein VM370_01990 [Candidatus Thermoplasmatota archaeon]|nr:hypothetical protein [Candidatus Thermoplasmatota archaeon]
MDPESRRISAISLLALLGAIVGGWYGLWAKDAGFALSSVSWGFSVVLLPVAIAAGVVLGHRARRLSAALAATSQAAMTLAFSAFSFALRSTIPEIRRIPWQVAVVLLGDVVVTTAGLALAAAGVAYALSSRRASDAT